jgi:hypothetical protein
VTVVAVLALVAVVCRLMCAVLCVLSHSASWEALISLGALGTGLHRCPLAQRLLSSLLASQGRGVGVVGAR